MKTTRPWTSWSAGLGITLAAALVAVLTLGGEARAASHMKEMIQKLQEMNQRDGYLEAHRGNRNPPGLLGGPIKVSITQERGGVFVGLPAHRELDPRVFGPMERPHEYTGTPGISGVPPAPKFRAKADGGMQTGPKTPFGDKHVVLPNGFLDLNAVDATANDGATTKDQVKMVARWEDKEGNTYEVRCCKKMAAHGLEWPTFGGVVTNHLLHGWSGVGTPLMPTEYTYFAFWGMGQVMKNGEVTDAPRAIHGMLTEYVRTEGYELGFDADVEPNRTHFHLMVAPFQPMPEQHKYKHVNVKTGFMLPNGKELPFWHVMFESLEYEGSRE